MGKLASDGDDLSKFSCGSGYGDSVVGSTSKNGVVSIITSDYSTIGDGGTIVGQWINRKSSHVIINDVVADVSTSVRNILNYSSDSGWKSATIVSGKLINGV